MLVYMCMTFESVKLDTLKSVYVFCLCVCVCMCVCVCDI